MFTPCHTSCSEGADDGADGLAAVITPHQTANISSSCHVTRSITTGDGTVIIPHQTADKNGTLYAACQHMRVCNSATVIIGAHQTADIVSCGYNAAPRYASVADGAVIPTHQTAGSAVNTIHRRVNKPDIADDCFTTTIAEEAAVVVGFDYKT